MDPNRAWQELLSLIDCQVMTEGDKERAIDLADSLERWLGHGGFVPEGTENMGRIALARLCEGLGAMLVSDMLEA